MLLDVEEFAGKGFNFVLLCDEADDGHHGDGKSAVFDVLVNQIRLSLVDGSTGRSFNLCCFLDNFSRDSNLLCLLNDNCDDRLSNDLAFLDDGLK